MSTTPGRKPLKTRPKKGPTAVTPSTALAGTGGAAPDMAPLLERIVTILEGARSRVLRSVNSEMVLAYWHIGRELVESHQAGSGRAEYGERIIDELSRRLTERVGRGYSTTNLRYFRTFYLAYADRRAQIRHIEGGESSPGASSGRRRAIRHTAGGVLADLGRAVAADPRLDGFSTRLGWSHYRLLMNVEPVGARRFYELEAECAQWSVPHLERQIHTQLFARLLKSRDKAGVVDLASRGQVLERPADAIKHPYVLDFLALPESPRLRESDLQRAILEKMQHFLLELGKGFAFVARQKRMSFEDEHFYVDLVFYNVVLKCYLLIDLKLGKLTHQDVGQMDSYVRLFDAQGRTDGDGPTIGLILCAEKNDTVARYSVLHENEQLFAAKYVMVLPSVEELEREVAREKRLIEDSERLTLAKKGATHARARAVTGPRGKSKAAPRR